MTSWLAIINPRAGSAGAQQKVAAALRELKSKCPGEFEQVETQHAGHATELAQHAAETGRSTVLSFGGDGTHNEVLNGLLNPSGEARNPDTAMGVINAGTGGDFVRFLYGNRDPQQIAKMLLTATPSKIDVGRCSFSDAHGEERSRLFLNIASFGLSGDVVHHVNASTHRIGGQFSYLLGTIRALMHHRSPEVTLIMDEGTPVTLRLQTAAVANAQYFGGGMKISPKSDIRDGLLDLVTVEDMSMFRSLMAAPRLYVGAHLNHPNVGLQQARFIKAEATLTDAAKVRVELDGEQPGFLPATFGIIPGALKLLIPEASR